MMVRKAFAVLLGIFEMAAISASAAITGVWSNPEGGQWSDPANWQDGAVPGFGEGDTADLLATTNNITLDCTVRLAALTTARTLTCGTDAGLIFKGTNGTPARLLLQVPGSTLNFQPSCGITLESDLDLDINGRNGSYNRIGRFRGHYDVHFNRNVSNGSVLYATDTMPEFFGNWAFYHGYIMTGGGADVYGCTTNEMTMISLFNKAAIRNNGAATLAKNRRVYIDETGGVLMPNGREWRFEAENALVGTGTLQLDDAGNHGGAVRLNQPCETFSGRILCGNNHVQGRLILGAQGSIPNVPEVYLATTNSHFNVTNRLDGYTVPAGQIISGVGCLRGTFDVCEKGAVILPGQATDGLRNRDGAMTVENRLVIREGGTLQWTLRKLADPDSGASAVYDYAVMTTLGEVRLEGGLLQIAFPVDAQTGLALDPDSGDAFWLDAHAWPIITAAEGGTVSGSLRVTPSAYAHGGFRTRIADGAVMLDWQPGLGTTILCVR